MIIYIFSLKFFTVYIINFISLIIFIKLLINKNNFHVVLIMYIYISLHLLSLFIYLFIISYYLSYLLFFFPCLISFFVIINFIY